MSHEQNNFCEQVCRAVGHVDEPFRRAWERETVASSQSEAMQDQVTFLAYSQVWIAP